MQVDQNAFHGINTVLAAPLSLMAIALVLFRSGTLEVLKAMQDLNVHLDVDTYSTYVLPTFSSVDSARVALQVMAYVYTSGLGM